MNRYYFLLAVLLAIPCVLWLLPASFFDDGPALCPSVLLLNTTCPGCGLTRGVMYLMHFDMEMALYYNPLSLVALPVMFLIWLRWVRGAWQKARSSVSSFR